MGESSVTTTTYTCDRCGAQSEKPFPLKGRVQVTHDLLDYQGAAVAGFNRTLDLCRDCLTTALEFIIPAERGQFNSAGEPIKLKGSNDSKAHSRSW